MLMEFVLHKEFLPLEDRNSFLGLKGPKHELFGFGFFTLIKPIWIGDLGTRPKKNIWDGLGLKIAILYFLAL
jgi:hypothetical protein